MMSKMTLTDPDTFRRGCALPRCAVLLSLSVVMPGAAAESPLAASTEWSRDHAAHLLRRAGFSGTPDEIERFTQMGRRSAVYTLVHYERQTARFQPPTVLPYQPPPFKDMGEPTQEQREAYVRIRRQNEAAQLANITEWWIRRMISTPRPLEERLVLFWHGHLTSGIREVQSARFMFDQNNLFRRYAYGDYRELLLRIAADPAMLRYLDNDNNVAREPNENFARELLELFTMGEGHYAERDIKEVARAFTGWSVDGRTGQFTYNQRNHDDGVKMLFGRYGRFQGTEVIDVILQQPQTARFMADKLWRHLAGTAPSDALLDAMALELRRARFDFRPLIEKILLSDAFYEDGVRWAMVKSPVDLVVGTCRLLEIDLYDAAEMSRMLRLMGQQLYQPPNVKGWDGGVAWINTATLFERYNFANGLIYGSEAPRPRNPANALLEDNMEMAPFVKAARRDPNSDQPPFDPAPMLRKYRLDSAEAIVDHFVARLWQRTPEAAQRAALIAHVRRVGGDLKPDGADTAAAVRGLIHLLISAPEYQVM